MKKILVPTDFSEQSGYALDFAYDVAKKSGSQLILMHVVEDNTTSVFAAAGEITSTSENSNENHVSEILRGAQREMNKIMGNPDYQGVSIRHIERTGNPFTGISRIISEEDADLVIMGTSGATNLEEWFVGSNTEKVVRMAHCPVISIPSPARPQDIQQIVFATNFDHNEEMIKALKTWQELLSAQLLVVRINTPHNAESENYLREQLNGFARYYELENYQVHVHNSVTVEAGILDFVEQSGSDMIAIATHGRRGIFHLFTGSIAEDVVNHTLKPVWTYSLKA